MSKAILPGGGPDGGEFLFYRSEDGASRVEVRVLGDTVWLSLTQLAGLFDRDKSVISRHISNVFEDGELERGSVVAEFATTAADGKVYRVEHFNLDVIISVGYRVKSLRGTHFRIWATQRLREFIVKGFTMDDARLKAAGGGDHFDELLARIRDIRSSERVFWRKVLDIYATSEDYDPRAASSMAFFQTVQNKMHWAIHGQTAAEVIHRRADAAKPNMGMTAWAGASPRKSDTGIAKNYLAEDEVKALNLIVSAYLDFAELQALNRRPMTMAGWIKKLDDFLRLSEREIQGRFFTLQPDPGNPRGPGGSGNPVWLGNQSEGRKIQSAGLPQLQWTALPSRPSPAALSKTDVLAASRNPRGFRFMGPSIRLRTLGTG